MNDPRVIKFGEWWDGESFTTDNPYHKESFAYWAWEGWQAGWKGASTVERLTDYERGYEQGKADAMRNMRLQPVQVSPLEFVTAVLEKEHLVGKPIMWAQWPNEEKNGGSHT
jgi:hypothetical protein